MGLLVSKMVSWVWSGFENDPANILMLGLDGAGKTTITYKLKLNEQICTIPTIGFNVETIDLGKGVSFTVWDIGGQELIRNLWHHYYRNARGLVFVVDSSDRHRLDTARDEFHAVLRHDDMRGVPVVVLANKQDLPGACSTAQLADRLGLNGVRDHEWYIQSTCAVSGEGLYEGMHNMARMAKNFKR